MMDVLLRFCKTRVVAHRGFVQLVFTGVWRAVGHESDQHLLGRWERDWEFLSATSTTGTGLAIYSACFKGRFADCLPGIRCRRCRTWCVF